VEARVNRALGAGEVFIVQERGGLQPLGWWGGGGGVGGGWLFVGWVWVCWGFVVGGGGLVCVSGGVWWGVRGDRVKKRTKRRPRGTEGRVVKRERRG